MRIHVPSWAASRRFWSNTLIVLGVLCLLYYAWINYSGRVYQMAFNMIYEHQQERLGAQAAAEREYTPYDELPSFLFIGQTLLPSNEAPALVMEELVPEQPVVVEKPKPAPEDISPIAYTERSEYVDYDMVLQAPRMGLRSKVIGGTSVQQLKRAPGLYSNSLLPCATGATVSIAAHRDVYGAWFYNIDRMTDGDRMYLHLGDKTYTYEYESTLIVEPTDTSVLNQRGYGSLVLTSCTPKGTSKQRIIVIGRLIMISARQPYP
ncbi:MAG: class E sortase [Syntrophomonadaceae bacterium]|nr:class E sortase [Syntrophomonadaceae bacterium]